MSRARAIPKKFFAALKVLVVDDDAVVREGLRGAVLRLGLDCRVAQDGDDAWELHRAEPADVIVCAMRLRGVTGPELCNLVRSAPGKGAYTHFILTANPEEASVALATQARVDDCLVKPIDSVVLQRRLASIGRMHAVVRKLVARNAALRRENLASFRLARIDSLTGVRNRLRMDEDIAAIWAQAKRYHRPYCAALCDIDWFKSYNDAHGHLAGDRILRRVARAIGAELRQGDILYRYGGEEFLVLLPEQSAADAAIAMERVRRGVERMAIPTPAGAGVVTISIGVAPLLPHDEHPLQWLAQADSSLYAAKARGRNRVEIESVEDEPVVRRVDSPLEAHPHPSA